MEIWEDLKRRILHSTADFHVLDKPARLVVQGDKKVSLASLIKSGLSFADGDETKYFPSTSINTTVTLMLYSGLC